MEKIINDRVDKMLSEMEAYFKEAVEGNTKAKEELDEKVKALIDEHDKKEEVKRYVKIKDISDYIALSISMPIPEGVKEEIIEALVKECKENGGETKESV